MMILTHVVLADVVSTVYDLQEVQTEKPMMMEAN